MVAVVAAVYANVLDNLPAVLLMAGVLEGAPTDTLLAAVVGASVGCTVLPHGSLATLLWQRLLVGARRPAPVSRSWAPAYVITPLVVVVAVAGLRIAPERTPVAGDGGPGWGGATSRERRDGACDDQASRRDIAGHPAQHAPALGDRRRARGPRAPSAWPRRASWAPTPTAPCSTRPAVYGTVTAVEADRTGYARIHRGSVEVRYEVDGHPRTATVSVGDAVADHPVGSAVTVVYDRHDPGRAALDGIARTRRRIPVGPPLASG